MNSIGKKIFTFLGVSLICASIGFGAWGVVKVKKVDENQQVKINAQVQDLQFKIDGLNSQLSAKDEAMDILMSQFQGAVTENETLVSNNAELQSQKDLLEAEKLLLLGQIESLENALSGESNGREELLALMGSGQLGSIKLNSGDFLVYSSSSTVQGIYLLNHIDFSLKKIHSVGCNFDRYSVLPNGNVLICGEHNCPGIYLFDCEGY